MTSRARSTCKKEPDLEKRLYEAMFIVDAAKGGAELPAAIQHIAGLLQRHGGDIERLEKWDERKLVYTIRQVERGIYVLAYFRAEPDKIAELRRDIRLSEEILRVLILLADQVAEPKGELFTPQGEPAAVASDEEPAVAAEAEDAGTE